MFLRTRWRLVAWNVLVLGIMLLLVSGVTSLLLSRGLTAAVDQNLAAHGNQAAESAHELAEQTGRSGHDGYQSGLFFVLAAPDGRLLANPQGLQLTALPASILANPSPRYATLAVNGEPMRLYVRSLAGQRGSPAVLAVGQSLELQEQLLHRQVAILLASGGGGLVLSLVGAWFLAGRALVPIQQAFARQQAFVADASHELRTPLAILRVAADLLYQRRDQPAATREPLLADLRMELARLERLASDLLILARSDLGQLALATGEVDVAALAAEVVRRLPPLAAERDIDLRAEGIEEPLVLEGDPDRLQQVLLIVLDNAFKYSPPGGQVAVCIGRRGRQAMIWVRDTGPGIAPEDLAQIFDRFARGDVARASEGTGLGLAIAQALVQAHGGRIALTSAPGKGTSVTISLPLGHPPWALVGRIGQPTVPRAREPSVTPPQVPGP